MCLSVCPLRNLAREAYRRFRFVSNEPAGTADRQQWQGFFEIHVMPSAHVAGISIECSPYM